MPTHNHEPGERCTLNCPAYLPGLGSTVDPPPADQPSDRERREYKRDPRDRGCTCTWDEIEGAEGIVRYDWNHCPIHSLNVPEPEEVTGTEVSTWVDKAMFQAEDIEEGALEEPKVYLLSATPDPLGAVAAVSMMYEGRVIRDLSEITDDERRHYYDECFKTTLKAPLEFIDFHFMVEGVTRAHSHQEVRQRTAVFGQESMRFAVKDRLAARPGPIISQDKKLRDEWRHAVDNIFDAYQWFIANGVPAEEARGILPHDTLTRLHHKVNLRNLMDEVGKRLCTQAQFDWKLWASAVRCAISEYLGATYSRQNPSRPEEKHAAYSAWQFEYIAQSPLFVPICFNTGRCMFKAAMDRGCTIRERVELGMFETIKTEEWAADPRAGWTR